MKRATFAVAALLAGAAIVHPGWHGGTGAAVAATPTPAALQYDEITRMVLPPGTPPPPGAFSTDYQTIVSASSAPAAPRSHGFGGLLGAVMSGNPGLGDAAAGMMLTMRNGHLVRYAYYKGWIRTDDVVAQTATIQKCDQHQYVTLDLAKKTYTQTDTQPACPTPAMPMGGGPMHASGGNAPPGTVDMTINVDTKDLGPMTIDDVATKGSEHTMELAMANATGSCHDGNMSMSMTQYVSGIPVPRAYCPIPHAMNPGDMVSMRSGGGCKPNMHVNANMGGIGWGENVLGRLVIYSRMSFNGGGAQSSGNDPGAGRMAGMGMVTERGNVKWVSGADAEALFAIPPGFTKA